MIEQSASTRWFGRIMWLGIVANLALALPTIAAPGAMLALMSLPTATPDLWVRFAGVLLVLLSAFYIPAAIDPHRYRASAWLAVAARLVGVGFFAFEPGYRQFALFDGVFLIPLGILLLLLRRTTASHPRAVETHA